MKRKEFKKDARKEFTSRKRLSTLVRKEHHGELQKLIEELRPSLVDGDSICWKTVTKLEGCYSERKSKAEFILKIAMFLESIGRGDGLEVKPEAFIRYLSSSKHSNLGLDFKSLKSKIYSMLRYLKQLEKGG